MTISIPASVTIPTWIVIPYVLVTTVLLVALLRFFLGIYSLKF